MALHLCRPKHRFPNNPSLVHLFSTSPPDENDNQNPTPHTNRTSFNTFSDVIARLKTQPTSTSSSANEIMKNLSEFRQRTAPPPMGESTSSFSSSSQSSTFSFQEIYRRNHNNEVQHRSKVSFDSIRNSLNVMNKNKMNGNGGNTTAGGGESGVSWGGSRIIGGTQELPSSIFGKEMMANLGEARVETGGLKTAFLRTYNVEQLGEKLKELRPEGVKSGEGFSLQELNERLLKLRESDKQQSLRLGVIPQTLRESLYLSQEDAEKKKRPVAVDLLGRMGGAPSYMEHPPQELLVEKYFHPDNMSSAEKMKIELSKVRDEFKMSESDCGSARVQVAQLTTKIKHLSSVLHKRDKHSLKGLQAMVQKRKRLLKYLRRTDWDSYCFVLSKLGLRDNPDYKA